MKNIKSNYDRDYEQAPQLPSSRSTSWVTIERALHVINNMKNIKSNYERDYERPLQLP